jgi:hypothetical protein
MPLQNATSHSLRRNSLICIEIRPWATLSLASTGVLDEPSKTYLYVALDLPLTGSRQPAIDAFAIGKRWKELLFHLKRLRIFGGPTFSIWDLSSVRPLAIPGRAPKGVLWRWRQRHFSLLCGFFNVRDPVLSRSRRTVIRFNEAPMLPSWRLLSG